MYFILPDHSRRSIQQQISAIENGQGFIEIHLRYNVVDLGDWSLSDHSLLSNFLSSCQRFYSLTLGPRFDGVHENASRAVWDFIKTSVAAARKNPKLSKIHITCAFNNSSAARLGEILQVGADKMNSIDIAQKGRVHEPAMKLLNQTLSSLKHLDTFVAKNIHNDFFEDLMSRWSQHETSNLKSLRSSVPKVADAP